MVAVHELERLAPDQMIVATASVLQEHRGETKVVGTGREEPETTTLEHVGRARGVGGRHIDAFVEAAQGCGHQLHCVVVLTNEVGEAVHGGQSVELVVGHSESGLGHAERTEESFLEEVAERLVGEDLDQTSRHVDAHAVVPASPGLGREGNLGQRVDQLTERARGVVHDAGVAVHLGDGGVDHEVVGQATGVGEEITHFHRAGLGHERAIGLHHLGCHERRNELANGVLELECAFFVQQHQRGRDDRLGHRVDAKDRVVGHRRHRLRGRDGRMQRSG